MDCPKAKGNTRTMSGLKPVLVNEREKSFIVDPKVFIVWSLCNGKNSIDDIRVKLDNRLGIDGSEIHGLNVPEVVNSLVRIGLVET